MLLREITYTSEMRTVSLEGTTLTIENRRPVLTEAERTEQYRAVESELYDIFIQYAGRSEQA